VVYDALLSIAAQENTNEWIAKYRGELREIKERNPGFSLAENGQANPRDILARDNPFKTDAAKKLYGATFQRNKERFAA
ncbi:MAG: hypothetical protein U9O94_07995, partial [Nanoarchaeota archaeon]|nr:hypothetical protein [Nanoarchaeota archaeon]